MNKEFNYSGYRKDIIKSCIDNYGSLESAVVGMDAVISSLSLDVSMKDEIISEFQENCEHRNIYYGEKEPSLKVEEYAYCEDCNLGLETPEKDWDLEREGK